jgi:hypothetical protein
MVLDPTVRYRNVFSNNTQDGTRLKLRVSSPVITACRWTKETIPRRWYIEALRHSKSPLHDQASESELALAHGKADGNRTILIFVSFHSPCHPNRPSVSPYLSRGRKI